MAGRKRIALPDEVPAIQQCLFELPGARTRTNFYPPIGRTTADIERILGTADGKPMGTDLEFTFRNGEWQPTILGYSNLQETAAVRWDEELAARLVDRTIATGGTLVGYSVLGADRPVYERSLGRHIPLEYWDDAMLAFYLCNSDYCKSPAKTEDSDDTGAMGLMNLWSMSSLYTDLPQWKVCRGKVCVGPCPEHAVFEYCAVDSYAGLKGFEALKSDMEQKRIPWSLYRDLMRLSEMTEKMKEHGIRVDQKVVGEMEKLFEERKAQLFPFEMIGGKPVFKTFNPRSPKQVSEYFKSHGVTLDGTDKDTVYKALETEANKSRGKWEMTKEGLVSEDDLPEHIDTLNRLYLLKSEGKGLKSWFDSKYLDANSLIHPRFIVTATSTGRLSSSGPNVQNVAARGWGEMVRRCIVARPGYDLLKSDYSQLELRVVLYLAGVDPRSIGKDAFTWLVQQSNGLFAKAAELASSSERQVAKSVSHGGSYMEGLRLLAPADLSKSRVRAEIEYGALRVYLKKYMPGLEKDWTFRGHVVAFTGSNLAERLFGDKTLENRKKALAIQEDIYMASFPAIRKWQQRALEAVEDSREIHSAVGRYLALYGDDSDDCKMTAAFHGQGTGADFVQGIMLKFYDQGDIPLIQCHDELVFEIPEGWSDKQAYDFISLMGTEDPRLPGFLCPFKSIRGKCWVEGRPADPKKNDPGNLHIPGVLMPLQI